MEYVIIFSIIIMHWVADFLLQSQDMAMNKSKSNYWLSMHVFYYTMGLTPVALLIWAQFGLLLGAISAIWLLINGAMHWVTDYYTSRWTSRLYREEKFYGFPSFFSVIGLDQTIHYCTLIGTYLLLSNILTE